jgi:hypothetical protein
MSRTDNQGRNRVLTPDEREALEVYDKGEWPVRDWLVAVTMRQSGYSDDQIRDLIGYLPDTDAELDDVVERGMSAILHEPAPGR